MNAWHEHFERARAAIELKRWDLAHEHILKALADSPNQPLLHATRAEICYRLREYSEAREAARQAINHEPQWSVGYYWLAWSTMADFLAGANRADEAIQIADRALQCTPNDPDCHYLRAMIALWASNTLEALTFAKSGLEIAPEHIGCLEVLARAHTLLVQDRKAEQAWRRLLQLCPESVDAHEEMTRITLRGGRFAEAYQHASTAIRQQPDSSELRELHAEVVRHQHPLARFFLWSAKPWSGGTLMLCVIVWIGLGSLFSLKLLPPNTDKRIEAVLAALAFFFCLGFISYGVWAGTVAETIIAHSTQWSRVAPEARALRSVYAFAWIAVMVVIAATLVSGAFMTGQPILLAGNAVLIGVVEWIARFAPNKKRGRATRLAMAIPLAVEGVGLFASFPETMHGSLPGLVMGAWCTTIASALIISGRSR